MQESPHIPTGRSGWASGVRRSTCAFCSIVPWPQLLFLKLPRVCQEVDVPQVILDAIRLGRLTAFREPNGGVERDCGRRHRAQVGGPPMVQQVSKRAEKATTPQRRSNTLCRRGRAQSASPTCSKPSQIWMIGPQWSLWMALVRSMWSHGKPCCQGCVTWSMGKN